VTDKKLKILLLGDCRSFKLESYVPELKRQDCEVILASVENGALEHHQLNRRGPIKQLHYTFAAGQLRRLAIEIGPDIIEAHDGNYGYLAALALRNSKLPINICLLGPDIIIAPHKSIFHKIKTVFALSHAAGIVADSEYLLSETRKLAPPKQSMVAPFGIEERFLELHKKDYTLSQPLKVIVPRHQEKFYNNEFILRALAPLLESDKISLTFSTTGSLATEFKAKTKRLGCPNVIFYERMERQEFLKFMSSHDVYLTSALTDSSPVSLIDAMAMGLIPVIVDTPGVKEWLSESFALTFRQNDAEDLISAIGKIFENKVPDDIRTKNLGHVRQKAIFENYVTARIEHLKRLINNR